jgi:hypothetical protein
MQKHPERKHMQLTPTKRKQNASRKQPESNQLASWRAGWLAGCLPGWLAGWLAGTKSNL